jgi:hypothetical protein
MYLAWFDADRKKPVAQKIAEAHERYVIKFGRQPLVCLVNPEDVIADAPIALRPLNTIGRNCFWIGMDESDEPAPEPEPEPVVATAAAEKAPRAKRPRRARAEGAVVAPPPPAPIAIPETRLPAPEVAPKGRRPRRERTAA